MTARSALQIVTDHYAASARGDLAGMLAEAAADVEWTEMAGFPTAGTWVGVSQVVDHVFKALGAEWDGFAFTPERLVDGGDTVVAIGEYSGVHRATGKRLRVRTVHVWDVAAGRIRRFEQFTDTLLVDHAVR
jgi:ketosteroid isomerase-like protein